MGGTLSKTKKVDFLNRPSYWKWCVWDGQCFGSFEVKLHVNILLNFETILARYQLTCPQPLFNSELDLPLPLFQDDTKPTQAKAAVEAAQEDWFCRVKTAGVIRVHPTGRLFFQGSNWFNLWPFRIKTDHRQTKWDMLALWIFPGWSNGNPVGPFDVNGNFEEPIAKLRRNLKLKVAKMSYLKWFAMEHGTLVCIPKVLHAWPKHENH